MPTAGETRISPIRVRRADPLADRESILTVLGHNLPAAAAPERHEWLYLSNPEGPAVVWLAEDVHGMPLGVAAAHPRRMRVGAAVLRALCSGDLAVDRAYRGLGVALQLLQARLALLSAGAYAFSYGYPTKPMHAIYERLGHAGLGCSERWVRPVSLKAFSRRKWGASVLAGVLGAAADLALRARDARAGGATGVRVETLCGECGPEFDALDTRLAGRRPVMGVRDSAYLNWRHRRHTMWPHTILCARCDDRLVGYAVLRHVGSTVSLVDLYAEENPRVHRQLIAAATRWARSRRTDTLDVEVLADSASARLIRSLGFVRREAHVGPVPLFARSSPYAETLAAPTNWWLMGGDRDI